MKLLLNGGGSNEELVEKYTDSIIKFSVEKGKVYVIPEENTIYIIDNSIEVLGPKPYYIVSNGNIETFNNK